MPGERDVVAQQFDVVVGEANLDSGFISSRLLGGASWKNSDGGGAETLKDGLDGFAKAVAVREEQHDRSDAPGHSRAPRPYAREGVE